MTVNLSIKNVPDNIVQRLRERAKQNHRSLQGELMSILEAAVVDDRKLTPKDFLAEFRRLGLATNDDGTAIIRADRDRDERS